MKRTYAYIFIAVLAITSCNAQLHTDCPVCNYSSAEISVLPEEHLELAGFAARNKLSDGIHSQLRTHTIVLKKEGTQICIVSSDIMEYPPVVADLIRDSISARTGIMRENILLHCIHTHSAPRFGGSSTADGGSNSSFRERAISAIVDCAVNTANDSKAFRPFRLEIGRSEAHIAGNRCEKNGPMDSTAYAVRLVDRRGKPICAFINLSCHPVCMGPGSYMVSADYSGVARKILAEKWGCEVFQLSGAQGNVDPKQGPKDAAYAELCGEMLAQSLSNIVFEQKSLSSDLQIENRIVNLPYSITEVRKTDIHKLADQLVAQYTTAFPRFTDNVRSWEEQMTSGLSDTTVFHSLNYNIHALNVEGLLFFFTQGEPFCEFQMEARRSFPDRDVIFAAYTNGQSSYIPSEHAFRVRKGYEYEIEQDFVYTKAPYSLSDEVPSVYSESMFKTLAAVAGEPEVSLIPAPSSVHFRYGQLFLNRSVAVTGNDSCFEETISDFKDVLRQKKINVKDKAKISICIDKKEGLPEDAYRLSVTERGATIETSSVSGAFYGLQTILQMLPSEGVQKMPFCEIEDYPRFAYRGVLLDCGRYFYPKEEIFKLLDQMALHKLNCFHWHLTEDQGWRIEIEKYPLLTEVGAWRDETSGYEGKGDGIAHGGFYTKADVREIVDYARRRCITIIPELELPGHSGAAIAAYPFLSCTPDEQKKVPTSWGVKNDVFCPSPETVRFLEDVLTEYLELFPSKYYHIGGDECPKDAWRSSAYCRQRAKELGLKDVDDIQAWFVHHFVSFLEEHGKTVIGWDEILERDPDPKAVILSYRGHQPGMEALKNNMQVIFAPNRWCYYDNMQDKVEDDPKNHHIFTTLRKAYNWDYAEMIGQDLAVAKKDCILGMECCLWGEFIPDSTRLEYQAFPRLAAMAEICWSPMERRNWNSFRMRIPEELRRLEKSGIAYCDSFNEVIVNMDLTVPYPRKVELELDNPFEYIWYGHDCADSLIRYCSSISVDKGDSLRAVPCTFDGRIAGKEMKVIF